MSLDFLDNLLDDEPKKDLESPLTEEDIAKLKSQVEQEELEKVLPKSDLELSNSELEAWSWSGIEKTRSYYGIVVRHQPMGQEGMPFLYHKNLREFARQIAVENNGTVVRADKLIPEFLKVNDIKDTKVILVHDAKSARTQLFRRRKELLEEAEKTKKAVAIHIEYDNKTYKRFDKPEQMDELKNELETFGMKSSANTVSAFEGSKYFVVPTKYFLRIGNQEAYNALGVIERYIDTIRKEEGKPPIAASKYYVCNQDEPYADKVIQIILNGEDQKLKEKGK